MDNIYICLRANDVDDYINDNKKIKITDDIYYDNDDMIILIAKMMITTI